ncbi:MAG: hypothetical protein Q7T82_07675 [Armatimonadota bacterium]|nr:hypothetical protein [Armatimonadota bacterium]
MRAKTAFITAGVCILALAAIVTLPVAPQLNRSGVTIVPAVLAQDLAAEARSAVIGGATVGEVLLQGKPVLRIRSSAGGLSPVERADVVARRLNSLASASGSLQFHSGMFNGQAAVLADDHLIVTADSFHAALNGMTTAALAQEWTGNLNSALPSTVAGQAAGPFDTSDENQVQKAVPIISIGSGLRVGLALVTGPSSQVEKVKVVAQVEGDFRGVRIRAFVPVETESLKELHRVPQTSIAGIADIKL